MELGGIVKEDLLKIINNYGISNQIKKLSEEVSELQEQIVIYETCMTNEYEIPLTELVKNKDLILEEFADCMVVLEQFKAYYELDNKEIIDTMQMKIKRQINRMNNEQK